MSLEAYMLFEAGRVFAVPLAIAQEVIVPLPTTAVPHRPHPGFEGLVDWQGRVAPCVCLTRLLVPDSGLGVTNKMIVLSLCGETIVCPVERVLGIRKMRSRTLEVAKAEMDHLETVARGYFPEVDALLLDEEKLLTKVREVLTCRA